MEKYKEKLSEEAELLNQYLNQYRQCISKKKSLEHRRDDIRREFDSPLKAVSYGSTGGGSSNSGCAALCFRLDEINTRIEEQIEKSTKVLAEIMDVIEFLPENSIERAIIEHRYIDRYSWEKVCKILHISRTPATRQWRKGLYELLEFKKVKQVLRDYEKSLEAL